MKRPDPRLKTCLPLWSTAVVKRNKSSSSGLRYGEASRWKISTSRITQLLTNIAVENFNPPNNSARIESYKGTERARARARAPYIRLGLVGSDYRRAKRRPCQGLAFGSAGIAKAIAEVFQGLAKALARPWQDLVKWQGLAKAMPRHWQDCAEAGRALPKHCQDLGKVLPRALARPCRAKALPRP